jgi:uncharacterized membrane protein YphA (DoxX/SURF4 family)
MLNPFPTLLSFAILAPFLLRLSLGIIFIYISYFIIYKNRDKFFDYYKKHKYPFPDVTTWFSGILSAIVGVFFILGFLTQIVAIVAIYLTISLYLSDKEIKSFNFTCSFYTLVGVISLSLMLLGAGAFAIDLPL